MRRTAVLICSSFLAASTPAWADSMTLQLDHSARIALPGAASNVFVGNSSIADVVVVDRRNLVVVGRGYGVTNVLVVDGGGRTIFNREVTVSSSDVGRMTLYRATASQNFACAPNCERTPMPGEHGSDYQPYDQAYTQYQGRADKGSSQSAAGGGGGGDMAAVVAAAAAGAAAGSR